MAPRNLCNSLLHKLFFREFRGEFRHVFQITDRITGGARERQLNILCEIVNKLIAPGFLRVNDLTDPVIQQDHFPVDLNSRLILRALNPALDGSEDLNVLV